jgi:hypothetical protein
VAEADRLEAGGFNLVIDIKGNKATNPDVCNWLLTDAPLIE